MRKFTIFVFVLYILHCTLYIPSALALETTPSADPLRQSDSEASIKSKLKELQKEIASKAAKLKQEISGKLTDKAYIGKVKSKSETSITIASKNGPKIVNINQDTLFDSNAKGKKYSQKSISEEDYLASLGDVDETGVLTAKKVILLPTTNSELKTYLWGQIISLSDKLVTLKDKNSKNISVSLPNQSTVKNLDFVILTGSKGKNDIFEAEFVYVIPQGAILKPRPKTDQPMAGKKIATPSAQQKNASASSKPISH